MGYDVHITRAVRWTEGEKSPVSLDEWKSFVASDPDMRLEGYAEATTPAGEVIRVESEGLAVWTRHPEDRPVWLDWRRGNVIVKDPDPTILQKMKEIAIALNAHVQGDEGEEY
jgi:hypothetical protein